MQDMKQYCQKHYQPPKGRKPPKPQSLATAVANMQRTNNLHSLELIHALNICIEANRPLETNPIDHDLVHADVTEIRRILSLRQPSHQDLFRIILGRSDSHIKQIATLYQKIEDRPLEEGIRGCKKATKMTRKIAEHAVRSANTGI